MFRVLEIDCGKSQTCDRILRKLPQWFGIESAIRDYSRAVEAMPMFVADFEDEDPVGFLSLNFHNEFTAEIHVMGVLAQLHGQGIGKALLKKAEAFARAQGAKFLTVKTLSPARKDPGYDMTRNFYVSAGFFPLEEFKTLWGEANPCLLMVKTL